MTKVRARRGLATGVILAGVAALMMGNPMLAGAAQSAGGTGLGSSALGSAGCSMSAQQIHSAAKNAHVGGVALVSGTDSGTCHKPPTQPAFNGTPPLLFNGSPPICVFSPCADGNLMMTASTGPLVVVPIFWNPSAYPMTFAYKNLITSYLGDVAVASGQNQNVYSVLNEYSGNNGQVQYSVQLGAVVNDTHPLPRSGCTLESADTSGIYADGSGYSACLDDLQLQAEVDRISKANSLPHDLAHIYVLYLPKHVESCFLPGETTSPSGGQACTINHEPTTAYCAYHSDDPASAVYANMDYPIYQSPVGFTCGSDGDYGVVESPNGNPDADTEISPTSHEISEAITDPDTETGWFDYSLNEIGDECAYIYGGALGAAGSLYNQTIHGQNFLTQEEFSNNVFSTSHGRAGCVPGQSAER
jgi:hypothetical protein